MLSTNQDFGLYTETYYKGEKYELHPGPIEQYQDLSGIIGDRVMSVNKI